MLNTIRLSYKTAGVVFRLARLSSGSLSYKVKIMKKYYNFYVYHTNQQELKFKQSLKYLQKHRQQSFYGNKIKSLYQKYSEKIQNQVQSKAHEFKEKQRSQYQKQVQSLLHKGMSYLSLYYESLQNLIEGRRQVLHDENFKFEDGQTVDQKRIKFEKYLSKLLGRNKQEVQKLQEEYQRKKQTQNFKQPF